MSLVLRTVTALTAALLLYGAVLETRAQTATPTPPIFVPRPFGAIPRPTPTPARKFPISEEQERPIPKSWIIGGAIAAAIVIGGILFGAARAWRSSNLFGRAYRFPVSSEPAAVRFGGEKCGGHMATVRFDGRSDRTRTSESKDA